MEIVLIVKTTQNDDSAASEKKEVKVCQSVEAAKKTIVSELCNDFWLPKDCDTYAKIVNQLSAGDIACGVSGDGTIDKIWWSDNGKGEVYEIVVIEDDDEYYII